LFSAVVAPLIEAAQPRVVAEVGAGAGRLTRRVLEAPGTAEAVVHAIDPAPTLDPDLRKAEAERLVVHAARSTAVLGSIGPVDLALLDGDPNWHSVRSELRLLARTARRAEREAPLIAVHNVHWPFGRRDGYHDPEAIPPEARHEHTDLGLVPGRREPVEEGLRLAPCSAVREFEPRSGVLTAVEDFVAESELDWTLVEVPGFHGVAVLAEARLLQRRPAIGVALEGLRSSRFLGAQARRAESARLEAELELAAARQGREEAPAPADEAPRPVEDEAPTEPEPTPEPEPVPTPERDALVAEAARERAQREAFEWRLERLEEDLAKHVGHLEELAAERAEAVERLRGEVEKRERDLAERDDRLREAVERGQLAEGRLAHSADLAEALRDERDRVRAEADRLRAEGAAARASLEEVAEHLDRAGHTRRARLGRWFGRAFGGRSQTPLDEARAAAERGLRLAPEAEPAEGAAGGRARSAVSSDEPK
jgi:hypothetical protein